MASPKQICDSLKVPDCVKTIPEFNGNPSQLHHFVYGVDKIHEILPNIVENPNHSFTFTILSAIRAKIVGAANDVLCSYGTSLIWADIKKELIRNFSDRRDETTLLKDLHNLSQRNLSIEEYFNKIMQFSTLLMNYVDIHENTIEAKDTKRILYRNICLKVFLAGLHEPMGAFIRARNPSSLAEALSQCLEEQNIQYFKRGSNQFSVNSIKNNKYNNKNNDNKFEKKYDHNARHNNFDNREKRTWNEYKNYNTNSSNNYSNNYRNNNECYKKQT